MKRVERLVRKALKEECEKVGATIIFWKGMKHNKYRVTLNEKIVTGSFSVNSSDINVKNVRKDAQREIASLMENRI